MSGNAVAKDTQFTSLIGSDPVLQLMYHEEAKRAGSINISVYIKATLAALAASHRTNLKSAACADVLKELGSMTVVDEKSDNSDSDHDEPMQCDDSDSERLEPLQRPDNVNENLQTCLDFRRKWSKGKRKMIRGSRMCILRVIWSTGYHDPSVTKFRPVDDLAAALYAITSDAYYRTQINNPRPNAVFLNGQTHFRLEVVTFLELLGGRPVLSETVISPRAADFNGFLFTVNTACSLSRSRFRARLGGLPEHLSPQWLCQRAAGLKLLSSTDWQPLTPEILKEIEVANFEDVFLIHTSHCDLPKCIEDKAASIQGFVIAWSDPERPYPPLEYLHSPSTAQPLHALPGSFQQRLPPEMYDNSKKVIRRREDQAARKKAGKFAKRERQREEKRQRPEAMRVQKPQRKRDSNKRQPHGTYRVELNEQDKEEGHAKIIHMEGKKSPAMEWNEEEDARSIRKLGGRMEAPGKQFDIVMR